MEEKNEVIESFFAGKAIPLTKENLLEFVTNHHRYASFVEIVKYFDNTEGDLCFGFLEYIYLW